MSMQTTIMDGEKKGKPRSIRNRRAEGEGNQKKVSRKPVTIPTDEEQFRNVERTVGRMVKEVAKTASRQRRLTKAWLEGLRRRDAHLLRAMNPWAGEAWTKLLVEAFEELAPGSQAQAVTILDREWDLLVDNYSHLSPPALKTVMAAMRRQLQRAFRGVPYLFMVDVSIDREARAHNNRRRLCFHLHGVMWTDRKRVLKSSEKFAGGHYGAPALKVRTMNDYGWLGYAARDPRLGNYWWVDKREWKHSYGRENEPIYSGQRRHLLRIYHGVTKPDLCLGSGLGREILQRARQLAKQREYVLPDRNADWSVNIPGDAEAARAFLPVPNIPATSDFDLGAYYDE